MFFLFDKLLIFVPSFLAGTIQYISVDYHFSNISRGVIDSRNIIYFLSVIGIFLFATVPGVDVTDGDMPNCGSELFSIIVTIFQNHT